MSSPPDTTTAAELQLDDRHGNQVIPGADMNLNRLGIASEEPVTR